VTLTANIAELSAELRTIIDRALELESAYAEDLAAVHPEFQDGARNLLHYLALRKTDIRSLQDGLSALGLASLGRAERNVLASLQAVQQALQRISSPAEACAEPTRSALRDPRGDAHKRAILGDPPAGRDVSIMVTLPREAADTPALVSQMIEAGMNVARINCAHDDAPTWEAMIGNVRKAAQSAGTECRIIMDLAGPKIRTGALRPGPRVVHIKPRRDPLGRTVAPRRIRFIPDDMVWGGTKVAVIPVPLECIEYAHVGDEFQLRDTRGKKRRLRIVEKDAKGVVTETYKGSYIATGTKLRLLRSAEGEKIVYRVGELPEVEQPILLRPGDSLVLHRDSIPGAPASEDGEGNVIESAHIACRQPEVFEFVAVGERISLNDGKIGGIIEVKDEDRLEITVTKAKPTGSRLRSDRGINFPDSDIHLPGLTESDRANLEFVARQADAVSLSFVKRPADILALQEETLALDRPDLGLIIKIETKKGFKNLPRLLLTAMRQYPAGVMIARGDLAVEAGWARLAEMQEEILWLCEAAQMPVIWATEVLERTAKKDQPSRAEISDAAMSQRADCVMLNKGPHIIAAIQMLDSILRRMQNHQYKKTPRLRELHFATK
jgi:pyruvate kinase